SLGLAVETVNPSFLAIDPSRRFLYAVNEVQKYKDAKSGVVSAFAIDYQKGDRQTGKVQLLNEVASRGADPCYIAFDKTGKYELVANYTGGSIAVFPVQPDGAVGEASGCFRRRPGATSAKPQLSFNMWGRASTASARKARTRTGSRPRPTIVL